MKMMATIAAALILGSSVSAEALKESEGIVKAREMMKTEAKKSVKSISIDELTHWMEQKKKFVLLDVREGAEVFAFSIPAERYVAIPRGVLEFKVGTQIATDETVVVACKSGSRSLLAAKTLQELGYKNVIDLQGGIVAWLEAGKPVNTYIGEMKADRFKYEKK
jgi:rhodanese-related sulfurtransferase